MDEITNYESVITWESGEPVVKYRQMLTKNVIANMPIVAMSMPYKRTQEEIEEDIDPEFEGKTNIEVMNIRLARKAAEGNLEAYRLLTERVLGRPKQEVQSTNLSMSYSEFLEKVTEEENENIIDAQVKEL